MGAGVSAGENNDDLVDNLMEADYIKSWRVERVFRAVDRGEYFLPPPPPFNPYRDVAWKFGDFHISAPCIYSEVMEGLRLEPGMSFLNLGSGTGYLSTMAGLLLRHDGINHGIELRESLVQYAYSKLEDFKKRSGAMDEFDFCEPKFIQGNCLCIPSGSYLYDRVYCGASCPEQYLNYMKNLIKVGGILIVPLNDHLMEMTRVSETNWNNRSLLPVSFAGLVQPPEGTPEMAKFFDFEPRSLMELCRTTVRNLLRKSIESDHPSVKTLRSSAASSGGNGNGKVSKSVKKKRPLRRMFKPLETSAAKFRKLKRSEDLFDYFLKTVARRYQSETASETTSAEDEMQKPPKQSCSKTEQVEAIIEKQPSEDEEDREQRKDFETLSDDKKIECMQDVFIDILSKFASPEASTSSAAAAPEESPKTAELNDETADKVEPMSTEGNMAVASSSHPTDNGKSPDKRKNRTKFDSGLGDEIISWSPPENILVDMSLSSSSSSDISDEDEDGSDVIKTSKRSSKSSKDGRSSSKWRKIEQNERDDDDDSSDYESDSIREKNDDETEVAHEVKMYKSPYSVHMENRIRDLPLPSILKKYLLFYREV